MASEPRTEAGKRLLAAIDPLIGWIAKVASADLPSDLAGQAKMPEDARREFAATILAIEAEATTSPEPARSGAEGLLRRLVAVCDAASMSWRDPIPPDAMPGGALHDAKEYLAATPTSPEPDTGPGCQHWDHCDCENCMAECAASKPDTDERERVVEALAAAIRRVAGLGVFYADGYNDQRDDEDWADTLARQIVEALPSLTLGSGADEGLREAAAEVLAAMGERPPEGPEPTTAEVERWYIANDGRIVRALAALRAALADSTNRSGTDG